MRQRVRALGLVVTLASAAVAGRADAVGRLLVPAGSSALPSRVRVALANAPGRTTLWVSTTLAGEAARVAWIVPVEPGTLADRASNRWLSALDDATAPRIFPPAAASGPGCGTPGLFEPTAEPPTTDELALTAAETLGSLDEVEAYAVSEELALGSQDRQVLGAHAAGARFLGLLFQAPRPGVWTEPVRITYPGSHSSLALDLLRGSSPVPTSLLLLGDQGFRASGLLEVPAERLMITWSTGVGRSDYLSVRAATLELHGGGVAVSEYSASAGLFDWTALPDGAGFVASGPITYFERELGAARVDALGCAARLGAFAEQTARASLPCPPGALARVPLGDGSDPSCPEPDLGSSFDAQSLVCGGADEVAYALGGLSPDAVLTRLELLAADSTPGELELRSEATPELGCAIRASGFTGAACGVATGTGGTSSGGAPLGQQGTGGTEPSGETTWDDPESPAAVVVDAGCSGPPPDGTTGDGCDGDSGTSSGSDGCCSSSGDGYSGDTCGSSNDGYSGDTCGSSSGGDGCGSSGGGYSGDTCSSGGGECSLRRVRRLRVRLSAWVMFAAVLVGPLRRWGRRRARA
jgi:hypothetical protein